jgi:hypothetical protein
VLFEPPNRHVEVQVDLLIVSSPFGLQALGRRVPMELAGAGIIDVLSCEDLILYKLHAGRLIDRADAGTLLRANRLTLDLPYLLEWADRLQVLDDLSAVWAEAFPGEDPPHAGS